MGYREALEAAGAKVLDFEEFGSYQGDWWAKVEIEGEVKWITGAYGSCSGCDAFEAEFEWGDQTQEKLADFGRDYVDSAISLEKALEIASENISWDHDAEEIVKWIKARSGSSPS